MKGPPPYLVRRLILAPLTIVVALAAIATIPLWILVIAFASRFVPGRWRILRAGWFLFLYVELQAVTVLILFGQWIASGFGRHMRTPRFQDLTYRTMAWWLRRLMGSARRTFSLAFDLDVGPDDPAEAPRPDRPLLVMSRHAGPGDSFLLVDAILNNLGRRPRIVLKDTLRVDPCIDIALSRVPSRFVPGHRRPGTIDAIRDMAATMGEHDAFVIFPEGGNFTVRRREAAIERLDEIGRGDLADRARAMTHVLPPKPGGALTTIAAAPTADIAFVGHVGLERLSTLRRLWQGLPMDSAISVRVWYVAAEDVPPPDQREEWLYGRWEQIDRWIDARLAEEVGAS